MNPKVKMMLFKIMGTLAKVIAGLWIFFIALNYLIVPLTQSGLQLPELFGQLPLLSIHGLGIVLLFWLGSKLSAAAAATKVDLESRFIGYLELYEDIGIESLANRLEVDIDDVENLIAQMKAGGMLKNVAVDKEDSRILYGKKAKEYLEAKPVRPARPKPPTEKEPVKVAKPEHPEKQPTPPPPARPTPVKPPQAPASPSSSQVDDKLYNYVLSHKGSFTYSKASRELLIPIAELKESMQRLKKSGQVISYRKKNTSVAEAQEQPPAT